MNCGLRTNNKSGFTGIYWSKLGGLWIAEIMVNYRKIKLGRFKDKQDAIQSRRKAELMYFGEFAHKIIC